MLMVAETLAQRMPNVSVLAGVELSWVASGALVMFIFLIRRRISKLCRPIAAKLCHVISISVAFIMQVQKFWGPSPKIFRAIGGQKTCKIWGDFTQHPTLIANISGTRQDIQNSVQRNTSGELWSTIQKVWHVSLDHTNRLFQETTLRPQRVLALKFLHALQFDTSC